MKKLKFHLTTFLIVAIVIPIASQHFPSRQYMTVDGMPSNSVFDIAQHSSGMMWFVTKLGPAYYDANSWYSFPDSLGLPTSYNSKIVIADSTIWVAGLNKTNFTIQYYTNKWVKIDVPFKPNNFEDHIAFNVFKTGTTYQVIIGGQNELHVYDLLRNKWTKIETSNFSINSIHLIGEKRVISTSSGLWELKDKTLKLFNLPYSELPTKTILTYHYKNGILHLLGYNWYGEITNNKVTFLLNDIGLLSSSLTNQSSLVVDQNGNVFFGSSTPARMINRENKSWQNLLINGENVNIGSTSIYCDAENNIWVSDSRGLFKFNVLQFLSYNKSSGLASDEVTAVDQLSDGTIVLSNPYHFNILKNNGIDQYSYNIDKKLTYRILSIEEDEVNNRLYMATNDAGLLVYDRGKYEEPSQVYSGEKLRITAVKSYNKTIYAAGDHGIYKLENNNLNKINNHRGIRNISRVGDRLAFLSNSNGIYLYDGSSFTHYNSTNYDLSSVYQGVLYNEDTILATRDGLGIIQDGEIKNWKEVAINSPAYGLLVDKNNQLWIGGDHGVYLYNGNTLQLFDMNQGLSGNEINRNALFEDSNGQVWIGTEKGVSIYNPDNNLEKNINLKVNITEVKTSNGVTESSLTNNSLTYDNNNLQISFNCLSFIDEDKINYRYRIDTISGNWIEKSDATNKITFSNLKAGDYQFEIQARFSLNEWGPISGFNFSIKKPVYMRWWFYVLSIFLLAVLARIIFFFRYLYLIRIQRKLKKIVAERTQEITELNQLLEEKVKERTKQLNDKNLKLEESAYMNAHHLRGPLTKIMSAVQIAEINNDEILDKNIIKILKKSTEELDKVIYSINDILKDE
ncbi:two-component regulator propeller domain-containing protein [Ekhidna sp.]|uniref:ligand-binding sensor domain-containing protein n=1 Tax=Ekhidna sp. TaxID=2608089 RepID=UPI00329A5F1D